MKRWYFLGIMTAALLYPAIGRAAPFAWVSNPGDGTVSKIDTATDTVISTITMGNHPRDICANHQGTRYYVTDAYLGNSVTVNDAATDSGIAVISVGNVPMGCAVNHRGDRVYVANYASNTASVINANSNTVIATISVGRAPGDVDVSPDDTRVYVSNGGDATVSIIDTSTNTVSSTLSLGSVATACGIAFNAQGNRVYIGTASDLKVYDPSGPTLKNTLTTTVPCEVAVNPLATRVYTDVGDVINTGGPTCSTPSVSASGLHNGAVAVQPTGSKFYVVSNPTVYVYSTSNNSLLTTIAVGSGGTFGTTLHSAHFIGPFSPL